MRCITLRMAADKDVTPQVGRLAQSVVQDFFLDPKTTWLVQPLRQDFEHGPGARLRSV